jgi:ankyrin repeat protein
MGETLIKAGLNVNQMSHGGMAPLHIAAAYGATEFAEMLLHHDAQVNLRPSEDMGYLGNTPLHWAAHKGHTETVKLLLKNGAHFGLRNTSDYTAADLLRMTERGVSYGFSSPHEVNDQSYRKVDQKTRTAILKLLESSSTQAAK